MGRKKNENEYEYDYDEIRKEILHFFPIKHLKGYQPTRKLIKSKKIDMGFKRTLEFNVLPQRKQSVSVRFEGGVGCDKYLPNEFCLSKRKSKRRNNDVFFEVEDIYDVSGIDDKMNYHEILLKIVEGYREIIYEEWLEYHKKRGRPREREKPRSLYILWIKI